MAMVGVQRLELRVDVRAQVGMTRSRKKGVRSHLYEEAVSGVGVEHEIRWQCSCVEP